MLEFTECPRPFTQAAGLYMWPASEYQQYDPKIKTTSPQNLLAHIFEGQQMLLLVEKIDAGI